MLPLWNEPYIFHVHTYRCGHASFEADEKYVKRAVELGAASIAFTDHAPFPGNPFNNRMEYVQLDEYISSLKRLKMQYKKLIDVHIGLEIEYLPSYLSYYEELRANKDIEILMLGQHHYEIANRTYNFQYPDHKFNDHFGLCEAMIEGMETGLFDVVAHPDRAFQNYKNWYDFLKNKGDGFTDLSRKVIQKAIEKDVCLEKNYSSMKRKNQYREEFWKLVPESVRIIYGCDAHSVKDLILSEI